MSKADPDCKSCSGKGGWEIDYMGRGTWNTCSCVYELEEEEKRLRKLRYLELKRKFDPTGEIEEYDKLKKEFQDK